VFTDGTPIASSAIYGSVETMSKKILLVDNNREYRHTMASMVRRVGYDVVQAEDVEEAIEKAASDPPVLTIIADSVEVAAWLKINQIPVSTATIIYTAQKTASGRDETLANGAAAILTKPISYADLRDVLRKHLHTSKNRPRPLASPCFVNESTSLGHESH
jgi:DNA-binding response OmpR family regulator